MSKSDPFFFPLCPPLADFPPVPPSPSSEGFSVVVKKNPSSGVEESEVTAIVLRVGSVLFSACVTNGTNPNSSCGTPSCWMALGGGRVGISSWRSLSLFLLRFVLLIFFLLTCAKDFL